MIKEAEEKGSTVSSIKVGQDYKGFQRVHITSGSDLQKSLKQSGSKTSKLSFEQIIEDLNSSGG